MSETDASKQPVDSQITTSDPTNNAVGKSEAGLEKRNSNEGDNDGANNDDDDDDDDESEDEDYDPTKENYNENEDEKTPESATNNSNLKKKTSGKKGTDEYIDDAELDKEIKNAKYDKIDTGVGGLIKTRRQRELEQNDPNFQKRHKKHHHHHTSSTKSNLDINAIWNELNSKEAKVETAPVVPTVNETNSARSTNDPSLNAGKRPSNIEPEKVRIERVYEFAGEIIKEEKWVDANSQEANAHFNSIKMNENNKPVNTNLKINNSNNISSSTASSTLPVSSNGSLKSPSKPVNINSLPPPGFVKRPPRRKRASLIDDVINGKSNAKLSTLEKSRLDWASYVDKQKISEELRNANKGGYLETQDFLARVDSNRDQQFKEARINARKQQQQQNQ
ncbi:unnamed protein product [[Candida] boidinii]|uniref:SWR1-complex protein 5 n=1 Tax=Candida boidinii TaxID=5477 RepID=A0A9W6T0Q4_CANBO|nr:hypothetical protein B5S30_g695 [[Candida] boidinii]GME72972.1 unnamed protein product [[Candida] boidinii]GMF98508.1 unnamed protein product [[Candida] boidinii]